MIFVAGAMERATRWGLILIAFVAPWKWGLPILASDAQAIPQGAWEWLMGSWPVDVFCLFVFFLFSLFLIAVLLRRRFPGPLPVPAMLGLLLFLGSSTVAMWFSDLPQASLTHHHLYVAYAFFFVMLMSPGVALPCLGAGVISAGAIALVGIVQRLGGLQEVAAWAALYLEAHPQGDALHARLLSQRVFGTFVYPNTLAGYLLMMLPVVAVWWVGCRRRLIPCAGTVYGLSLLWWGASGLEGAVWPAGLALAALLAPLSMALCIFFTQSQGAWAVACSTALGWFGLRLWRSPWRGRLPAVLVLAMLVGVLGILALGPLAGLVKWDTLGMRVGYWIGAWDMALSRWWMGYGAGTFGSLYPRFQVGWGEATQMAHGDALQVFAELGVVGLAGWLLFWLGWLPSFIGAAPGALRGTCGLGLILFLAHGLVDFDFFVPGLAMQAIVLASLAYGQGPGRLVDSGACATGRGTP